MTLYNNLLFYGKYYGVDNSHIDELLKKVGLYGSRKTVAEKLSPGMKQRMLLARALINKPTMIVGASLGLLGTSRAQAHLRQILDAPELKARVMPGTEFFLGQSEQEFFLKKLELQLALACPQVR